MTDSECMETNTQQVAQGIETGNLYVGTVNGDTFTDGRGWNYNIGGDVILMAVVDPREVAQDIHSVLGALGGAQNALAVAEISQERAPRATKAEVLQQVAYARADCHRVRGNLRTLAQRAGIEY